MVRLWLFLQKYTQQLYATGMQMSKSSVCILKSEIQLMRFHLSHLSEFSSLRNKVQWVNDSHTSSNKTFLHIVLYKYMFRYRRQGNPGRCWHCKCSLRAGLSCLSSVSIRSALLCIYTTFFITPILKRENTHFSWTQLCVDYLRIITNWTSLLF